MADDRTFVLIGNFVDNITGPIQKINGSIDALKKNLGSFAGKKGSFSDLTQSMGKVIGAHKRLSEEVKTLRSELNASIPVLREYRKEVGKTVSANMWLQGKGNKQRFNAKNNPTLQFLSAATRQTQELARASRGVQLGGRIPRGGGGGGGGGGGPRPPRPPSTARIPGGGGGGYVPSSRSSSTFGTKRFGVSRDETFAFGQTLGYTLGTTITGAVVQGFQIGVGFMIKPFQLFAGALQERVRDELSDISASGGLLSVAKRQKGTPLVKSFQDSMDLTQQTNKYMAEIAAALPGDTQQYIEVGKRLSDTAARMISADPAKAIAYAQELAAREGKGRTVGTQKQAYTQIIGNMATQGVLAGLGDGGAGGGGRGLMGAYGLPQLMERMMNDQEVSMGQFQRYAAIFRDPKIMEALERFIPKINATMKGTVDRARVFDKFFEEVLPPEMIRAFERSSAGIMEAFKTAFIGPETGLLGLGRKFENMGKKMDAYGRYLDENGDVTSFGNAVNASLSLFDMLRDIFANISISLYPLVDLLPQIFDPLKNIGDLLVDARHISGQFLQSFENYLAGLDQLAQTTKKGNEDFTKTKRARAGLLAITNFLTDVGAFSEAQFQSMRLEILNNPSAELGNILNGILTTFFESKAAYDLGNLIGTVIGTTLKQVATIIEYFLGVAKTSQLASGLKDGFYAAGGPEAFRSIIQNIFKALFTAIQEVFKIAPLEFSIIGSVALLLPATVAAFSIGLANALEGFIERGIAKASGKPNFAAAGALYDLDKAKLRKPTITGDVFPDSRSYAAKSPSGVLGAARRVNPQFPQVAMKPYPAMSLGRGFTAPGIFKDFDEVLDTTLLDDLRNGLKNLPTALSNLAKTLTPGKGIGVRIVSVGKNVKGFLGAAGTRLGAGGMAGLRNPLGMLGKFGTAVAGLTGIISGVATFFETGDIWKGLGAAAGPIIGTIIGTALLGPIGGIIGSWVGQQESVINGLGNIFENLAATFGTLIQFVGTLGKDIGWVISKIFNLGDNFDFLGALMKMLEAPFYYLRLGMLGIYELYLNATRRGNSPEAKALRIQREKIFGEDLAKREISSAAKTPSGKSYTPKETIKGLESSLSAYQRYVTEARAAKNEAAIAKNQVVVDSLKQEIEKLKKGTNTPTSAKPSSIFATGATPAAASAVPADVKQTASNIQQLNTKAATQITQGALTQKATEETRKNTATANTTLGNLRAAAISISNKLSSIQNAILSDLNNIQAGVSSISSLLASGGLKVKSDFGGGGLPGGGSGGPAIFGAAASKFGLTMTSGYRPGDPGYHGINRARDYSNGSGPTPQMMAFAQFMYSAFGSNLKELIYTPLGFSVKDGRKVAPYAQATHNDHVHVAWAFGPNNPVAFNSLSGARNWERSMVPGSAKIASVTTNSREGFGTGTNVVNNITINQQPGQNADELASIVALKIGEAVADARSASIFV
jgi:hypothetical protein